MARVLHRLILILALAGAGPAAADGLYASFDQSPDDGMAVLSLDRGALTVAAAVGDDGEERWGKLAVMRTWTVTGVRLKAGPSLRLSSLDGRDFGVRIGADRYTDRGTWGHYWMLEYDSIQQAGLALASVNHSRSGLGLEVSVWQQEDDPIKPTLMASWKMPGRDIAWRAGWRFEDREAFVGISVSRFR